ncbi:MAG: dTDP-4-dehydrorhamnose reductase [Patescibacteria group bacterium]
MKVLVTGRKGALGQDVMAVFTQHGHEVVGFDRDGLDITDREAVTRMVTEYQPEVIVNCAAYNAVDKAEEPDQYPVAFAINALGPRYLAEAAKQLGAKFVTVSTDAVFPGTKASGYVETDIRGPICKYGETKAAGEELVEQVGGQYYIVRTARLFGKPASSLDAKESFVVMMLRLAGSKPALDIIDEEVGSPTYTPDLAQGIYALVHEAYPAGIYHLVNSGEGVTWYAFAEEFFKLKGVTVTRRPVPASAFPKPAARGCFTVLLSTKFSPLRSRLEALQDFLQS